MQLRRAVIFLSVVLIGAALAECFDTTLLWNSSEIDSVRDPNAGACSLWRTDRRDVVGAQLTSEFSMLMMDHATITEFTLPDGLVSNSRQISPPAPASVGDTAFCASQSTDTVWLHSGAGVLCRYSTATGRAESVARAEFSNYTRVWFAVDAEALYVSAGNAVWRVSAADGRLEHVFAAVPSAGAMWLDAASRRLFVVMGNPAVRVLVFSVGRSDYGSSLGSIAVPAVAVSTLVGRDNCLLALECETRRVLPLTCGTGAVSTESGALAASFDALLSAEIAMRNGVAVRVQDAQPLANGLSPLTNNGNLAPLMFAPVQNTPHTLLLIDSNGQLAEFAIDAETGCDADLRALLAPLTGVTRIWDVQPGTGAILWRNDSGVYLRSDAFDSDRAVVPSIHSPSNGWLRAVIHLQMIVCALDDRGVWCGEQALPLPENLAPSSLSRLLSIDHHHTLLIAEPYDDRSAVRLFAFTNDTWRACDVALPGFTLSGWETPTQLIVDGDFVTLRWNLSTVVLVNSDCALGGTVSSVWPERAVSTAAFGPAPQRCTALHHQVIDLPQSRNAGWPVYWPVVFACLACFAGLAGCVFVCAALNYKRFYARFVYGNQKAGRFHSLQNEKPPSSASFVTGLCLRAALRCTQCCPPLHDRIDVAFQRRCNPVTTFVSENPLTMPDSEPPTPAWSEVQLGVNDAAAAAAVTPADE